MKPALTALTLALATTTAHAITFQQGTPITNVLAPSGVVQTQYLDIGGFHFEAQTNGSTLALAPDGLWNGTKNQAAALTITRTGGGAFNVGTYSTRNHAGISCPNSYCGAELIAYTALSVDGKKLFGGDTNYLPNTMFGTFNLSWMGAITSLTLAVDEPYVLGHINLSPVPEPSSYAMMLAGLISVSFYRRLHS